MLCPGHLKARIAEIAHKITKKFLRKRIPQEFPDFVTFLKSECNYLIIRCNYFCLGDALRNE